MVHRCELLHELPSRHLAPEVDGVNRSASPVGTRHTRERPCWAWVIRFAIGENDDLLVLLITHVAEANRFDTRRREIGETTGFKTLDPSGREGAICSSAHMGARLP